MPSSEMKIKTQIQFRWLGTACFEIRLANGETLVIDPYLDDSLTSPIKSNKIKRADLICITHGHFDHVLDIGRLAKRLGSTVICSEKVARNIEKRFRVPAKQLQPVTAGEILKRGSIQIEVVRAVHINNRRYFAGQLGIDHIPSGLSTEDMVKKVFESIQNKDIREKLLSYMGKYPAGEHLNYIFQFPGNLRLYFFGSTPDPRLLHILQTSHAQILILQVLSGTEESAFEFAAQAGASIVIPSHHDGFFPGQAVPDLKKMKVLFQQKTNMSFLDPLPGAWYEINTTICQV